MLLIQISTKGAKPRKRRSKKAAKNKKFSTQQRTSFKTSNQLTLGSSENTYLGPY